MRLIHTYRTLTIGELWEVIEFGDYRLLSPIPGVGSVAFMRIISWLNENLDPHSFKIWASRKQRYIFIQRRIEGLRAIVRLFELNTLVNAESELRGALMAVYKDPDIQLKKIIADLHRLTAKLKQDAPKSGQGFADIILTLEEAGWKVLDKKVYQLPKIWQRYKNSFHLKQDGRLRNTLRT